MPNKFLLLATFLHISLASFQSSAQRYVGTKISNPYYNAKIGKAALINNDIIQGKFYYHSPLFNSGDSFYFYPSDARSLRIIAIKEVMEIEFMSKSKSWIKYSLNDEKLQRKLPDGRIEILNTSILCHL